MSKPASPRKVGDKEALAAVTASTGIPNFSPSSTSLARLTSVSFSNSDPTKIESAMAETLRRIQSSMDTVMSSLESSFRILVPPETRSTMGLSALGSTEVRSTPRVNMIESAWGNRGSMVFRGSSKPLVGPRK